MVVEFSAAKGHLASSRNWHPAQVVTRMSHGRVRLTFPAPSLAPIVSWILEWGPHAKAIAPHARVEQIVHELDAARSQYASSFESRNETGNPRRPT